MSQRATIKGFSEEIEKGKKYYEAEMVVDGHGKDVLFDGTGTVVEVEEEVALSTLPAAVQAGLTTGAGKESEVQVGPDGKALVPEK
jgi:hypothetical protein